MYKRDGTKMKWFHERILLIIFLGLVVDVVVVANAVVAILYTYILEIYRQASERELSSLLLLLLLFDWVSLL